MASIDNQAQESASKEEVTPQNLPSQAPKKKLGASKKFLIFVVILIVLIYAYANWDGKFNSWSRWTEEVELSNGETIWVDRSTRYYGWSSINSGGRMNRVSSIQFKSPLSLPEWSFDIAIPMLLDFDEQKQRWFIVATFDMCQDWKDWGNPMPPYRLYELQGNQWELVPFDDELVGRNGNLLIHEPNSLLIRKAVTIQERMKIESHFNAGESYKKIVNYLNGCGNWK